MTLLSSNCRFLANDANYKQPKQTTLLITSVSAVRLSGRAYGRKVEGWFTLVRPSGPVWAFGPGHRTAGRHGKSWASRPARRLSRPSSVRPLPLVRMACRAGNHCNLVAGMRAFWRLSFTVVLTRIWTRIKANGRSFPIATPSSPFSAIRAPSSAATYLTSAGQSRWTLASRFGNGNIDENVGEWHRNSLKWSCQCNSVKFNVVISCWLKNFLSALIYGIEVYFYGYTK